MAEQRKVSRLSVREPTYKLSVAIATHKNYRLELNNSA
ncbi:hypothetical protein [Methylomonas fluvii]|nr:hypothetical protein [Methylomonas fluvii]